MRRAEHWNRDQTIPLSYGGLTEPVLCWARTREGVMEEGAGLCLGSDGGRDPDLASVHGEKMEED